MPQTPANTRSSNLELYRILCMVLIVAHHFVMHSGLVPACIAADPAAPNSIFLWLFGLWGKTAVNCFLLITGYFMCESRITLRKFLKLVLEVYFYKIAVSLIFFATGRESVTLPGILRLLTPVTEFKANFVSCFLGFYLTIPFWNILIHNMTQRQHQLLLALLLGMFTVLGSLPSFEIGMNYVMWFGVIYLISAYIRRYPSPVFERRCLWGGVALGGVLVAMALTAAQLLRGRVTDCYASDANKLLPVLIAVASFLWFKGLKIPQRKWINALGGSTFAVYLIHESSKTMRTWLWTDVFDCVGHYALPLGRLILFALGAVAAVFGVCVAIDRLRIRFLERPFFAWFDRLYKGEW